MKFKSSFFIVPIGFLLVACGSSTSSAPADTNSAIAPSTVSSAATVPPAVTITPTPIPTATAVVSTGACSTTAPENYYTAQVSGTGPYKDGTYKTASFPSQIIADHWLRVSIVPGTGSATSTTGVGGSQAYTKFGARVTLVKNGVELAHYDIPGQTDSQNFKTGINVNQASSAALADFSGFLSGSSSGYSIRVSQIQTNWQCKIQCTTTSQFYSGHCVGTTSPYYGYCNYYSQYGYTWTWDYNTQQYYCCDGPELQQCQQLQCGIGPYLDNGSWTVTLRVETDNTKCVP